MSSHDLSSDKTDVAANLAEIQSNINAACDAAGRNPDDVTLVCVSKNHDADHVRKALVDGRRVFGENRVQEAAGKWPELRAEFPDIELHLIGPLQTNKLKDAVALFDVIETVDRPKLAKALAKHRDNTGTCPDLFIQINTGEEEQKAGIAPKDADDFIKMCREELDLPIIGLMCIPPVDEEPAPHFILLGKIADRHGLKIKSMGMSGDYEAAIRFGATHVRVGTAIFGSRGY
ncbi:YggS family pyridoxal phosphate-dependent enzyme [Thalassospira sp.]|uniref:YggS family pyridoxal phosphate-dependent enzyme n=1 Tax=Thalassospira sp. TaxID=1912094 RepID=UPI000C356E56|nr:YggS family pyridoxal phosphate-dependent enzyme [Thalassospira sp.]MBC08300.1 YggS family pyridoxal phosphate-dependent enzyme [Thalassospira sp.]|tara:strand:- start:1204 stop:1899 length:696 start_codon:yes stop_codon:yes gene_type:complete